MQAHPACQLHAWEGPGFSHCTGEPPSATPSHPEPHTLCSSILALIASVLVPQDLLMPLSVTDPSLPSLSFLSAALISCPPFGLISSSAYFCI